MVLRNKNKRKRLGVLLLVLLLGVGLGGVFLTEIANIQEQAVQYGVIFQADRFVDDVSTRPSAWIWDETGTLPADNGGSWFQSVISSYGVASADIGTKADFQNAKIRGTLWMGLWITTAATRVLLKAENSTHSFTASDLSNLGDGKSWWAGFDTTTIADGSYTFTLIAVTPAEEIPLIIFDMAFAEGQATVNPNYNNALFLLGIIGVVVIGIFLFKRTDKRR
jgi:hypothetical protein